MEHKLEVEQQRERLREAQAREAEKRMLEMDQAADQAIDLSARGLSDAAGFREEVEAFNNRETASPAHAEANLIQARDVESMERLRKSLERDGVDRQHARRIAAVTQEQAEGSVARDDWMTLEADRFREDTRTALARYGLTPETVTSNPDKAELYAGCVFEYEGIPDGNGGTEEVRGVAAGHFDERGWGIDLVAADPEGKPTTIEVKKYDRPSAAKLEDRPVVELEDETRQWLQQRGGIEQPVQQMDEWWVRDRWLKLIKAPDGRKRMEDLGVDEKYLDYDRLRSSPDSPEWGELLERRATVIVSDQKGDAGKPLFDQAVFGRRSKRVMKIEL